MIRTNWARRRPSSHPIGFSEWPLLSTSTDAGMYVIATSNDKEADECKLKSERQVGNKYYRTLYEKHETPVPRRQLCCGMSRDCGGEAENAQHRTRTQPNVPDSRNNP